ncbi:hypothetical protein N0V93_005850 [Gnomoniopsis smithogilvyi]|uniref:cutinase n=1 Tax=Gnomoniopsis smithogilvyi TaxID=1191159 RepID=A0A9W9CYE2_9PEZI|nr:hypothetical protein N0V93_005850 [Gnomoniopsis smithogilvyi]
MRSTRYLPLLALTTHAFDLNVLLAAIDEYFPDNIALKTADKIISKAESAIGKLIGVQETRSDLVDDSCGDVMVIFARGTGEPGNIGALVAPAFYDELVSAMDGKTVSMQGVNSSAYPAVVADYFTGGSESGAEAMASYVNQSLVSCPDVPIVMSGWSQGAQVVHKAAELVGPEIMGSMSSVITFGDPVSSSSIDGIDTSKVLVICHEGDDVCDFGDFLGPLHFTYAKDTPEAASFVASHL